jgi:RNA polymerase sigma-70 factor (ECF subfamily)
MPYRDDSVEARLLRGEPPVLDLVRRWIAESLTSPRFWCLRGEWADLHQEVMARVIQSLRRERFRPDGELRSYVQGICRHAVQQRLAERDPSFRSIELVDRIPSRGERNPEEEATSHQLIRRALDTCTDDCRALISAYFLDEETYEALASRLALPVGTVKSRLFRCLQCVRLSLAEARPRARRTVR